MIVNGYRTIRLLCEKRDTPLSVELLHEIQESMTRDTLDDAAHVGHFRTDDTVVVVDGRDNEVVFTPPPAAKLEMRMKRLVEFANEAPESEPFVHPLVRAAILHFWLAYEHPYADGNGRTARALFYWSMLKSGYWLFEYLTISRIIHAAPMQYYRSFLYAEQDDNDLTYFLMFQLDVTQKALADLHRRLHALSESQQRMKSIQLAAALNSRQRDLLDHALRHPNQVYTFESHQGTFGVTYQTARTDLLDLAARGLLVETGSRKPRKFLPAPELPRKLRAPKARRT
jgi:Fic family protein